MHAKGEAKQMDGSLLDVTVAGKIGAGLKSVIG